MHMGNYACKRADMHITRLLIITSHGCRKCAKLVLKPFEAKKGLSISCVLFLSYRLHYLSWHDDYPPFLFTM